MSFIKPRTHHGIPCIHDTVTVHQVTISYQFRAKQNTPWPTQKHTRIPGHFQNFLIKVEKDCPVIVVYI